MQLQPQCHFHQEEVHCFVFAPVLAQMSLEVKGGLRIWGSAYMECLSCPPGLYKRTKINSENQWRSCKDCYELVGGQNRGGQPCLGCGGVFVRNSVFFFFYVVTCFSVHWNMCNKLLEQFLVTSCLFLHEMSLCSEVSYCSITSMTMHLSPCLESLACQGKMCSLSVKSI